MFGKFLVNLRHAWKSPTWRWALALALISDVLGAAFTFAPPVHWTIDLLTAALLFVAVGFKWLLLPGLITELIPGLQLFPFWTLFVMAMAGAESDKKPQN